MEEERRKRKRGRTSHCSGLRFVPGGAQSNEAITEINQRWKGRKGRVAGAWVSTEKGKISVGERGERKGSYSFTRSLWTRSSSLLDAIVWFVSSEEKESGRAEGGAAAGCFRCKCLRRAKGDP